MVRNTDYQSPEVCGAPENQLDLAEHRVRWWAADDNTVNLDTSSTSEITCGRAILYVGFRAASKASWAIRSLIAGSEVADRVFENIDDYNRREFLGL